MINTHEREDVVKERVKHIKKNKIDEINEPCFTHLKKTKIMKTLQKSNIKQSAQDILLEKCYYDEVADLI